MTRPQVTAVMLAYGAEPYLRRCRSSRAGHRSTSTSSSIVVDNGCTTDGIDVVRGLARRPVIRPEREHRLLRRLRLGAGGGHRRLARLRQLRRDRRAGRPRQDSSRSPAEPGVGAAMASIRLAGQP